MDEVVVAYFTSLDDIFVSYQVCTADNNRIEVQDSIYTVSLAGCNEIWHRLTVGENYTITIPTNDTDSFAISFNPLPDTLLGQECLSPILIAAQLSALSLIATMQTAESIWIDPSLPVANLVTCASLLTGATLNSFPGSCSAAPQSITSTCENADLPSTSPPVFGNIFEIAAESDGLLVLDYDGENLPGCFAAHTTVVVQGLGSVRMDSLRAGQLVLGEGGEWTPVVSWMHREEGVESEFVKVTHANGVITLSPDHMIWVRDSQNERHALAAMDLSIGDLLIDGEGETQEIFSLETVIDQEGYYAPLTSSGDIVVDGMLCSCFCALDLPPPFYRVSYSAAMIATLPQRRLPSLFGSLDNESSSDKSAYINFALHIIDMIGYVYSLLA